MEPELESGEGGIVVNYRPLLVIFAAILVAKLLRGITTPLCSWVVRLVTQLPGNIEGVKRDAIELRKELETVSITGDFPSHARLKRKLLAKEQEFSQAESGYRSKVYRRQALLETLCFVLLECTAIGVVLYYRSVPVLTLPTHYLWPVDSILQFPTGVPGGVGPPVWAVCTRQTLHVISTNLWRK